MRNGSGFQGFRGWSSAEFALFACRGAFLSSPKIIPPRLQAKLIFRMRIFWKEFFKMASKMGEVITIENFQAKMPKISPVDTGKPLYGLVDMGR